ncbi:MAG: hypothetical protein WD690_13565 [Vicinamibacterales bacterium]
MEQAQILFPDNIVQFQPRASTPRSREAGPRHLNGDGLAQRLRRDVERQLAHRRRMLAHLESAQARRRE